MRLSYRENEACIRGRSGSGNAGASAVGRAKVKI